MNTFWVIFEFLINFIEMVISFYLAYSLFSQPNTSFKRIAFLLPAYALVGALSLSLYSYLLPGSLSLLPGIVAFYLFPVFVFHTPPLKSLLWSLLNCLLLGFIAFTTDPILGLLFSKPIQVFDAYSPYRILSLCLNKSFQLLYSECIVHFLSKRRPSQAVKTSWFQIVIPICSIFCLTILYGTIGSVDIKTIYLMALLVCFVLMALNVLLLAFFAYTARINKERTELAAHNERLKMQMRNHQEIRQIYENLRMLRHDLNNHLHTLHGFIGLGEYQKADAYIEEMTEAVDELTSAYCQTGNMALDALISSKAGISRASGISMKVNALVPPRLSIPDNQLTVLLGNLLNNAIDACKKIPEGQDRVIGVDIFYRNKNLFISVKNPTNGEEKYAAHRWFTTKQNTFEHGFGLKSIDLIVSQYNGYCTREHKANVFSTQIRLPAEILPAPEGH